MTKHLNDKDFTWDGRPWIEMNNVDLKQSMESKLLGKIKFLSYNVFANYKCQAISYSSTKNWSYRSGQLLNEILSYDVDVMCLQDVDNFSTFWQPQLMTFGYDSVFQKRTCEKGMYIEGICIAYKRSLFTVFKTVPVLLNSSADHYNDRGKSFQERCISDNVGLIILIRPLASNKSKIPALCIGCALLHDDPHSSDVRLIQTMYFTRQIELANKEFQAPVLLGVSLNDNPRSPSYHVFRTGINVIDNSIVF